MFLHGSTIAIVVLSVLVALGAGYAIVAWLFRKDTEIENRRKAAITVSGLLAGMGLKRLPKILTCYAVGDYSGVVHELKGFADLILGDPKAVVSEFDGVFQNVLAVKVATPEGRAYVQAVLANAGKPAVTSAVVA